MVQKSMDDNSNILDITVYGEDNNIDDDASRTFSIVEHYGDDFDFYVERDLPDINDFEEGLYDSIDDIADNAVYKTTINQSIKDKKTNKFITIDKNEDVQTKNEDTAVFATDAAADSYLEALYKSKLDFMKENNIENNEELASILRSTESSKLINTYRSIEKGQETKHIAKLLDGFDSYIKKPGRSNDIFATGTELHDTLSRHIEGSGIGNKALSAINRNNTISQLLSVTTPILKDKHAQTALFKILHGDVIDNYRSPTDSQLYFNSAISGGIQEIC
jgi:hypothetical protein